MVFKIRRLLDDCGPSLNGWELLEYHTHLRSEPSYADVEAGMLR